MSGILKIIKNKRNHLLAGMGLISLLNVPLVVSCGSGSGDSEGMYNNSTSRLKYNCDCEGEGLFVTMDVYATSMSSAERWATDECRENYPNTGCDCECVESGSSSNGNNYEPPCVDECSPHFDLKCDSGPSGEEGTWKCQEYWEDHVRCLHWVWKGTDYRDNACD